MHRRASKVDLNQSELVGQAQALGFSVLHLHAVGGGAPDLLLGKAGINMLVEVKRPGEGPRTEAQRTWLREWRGQVVVAHSIEEVITEWNSLVKLMHGGRLR